MRRKEERERRDDVKMNEMKREEGRGDKRMSRGLSTAVTW